MLVYRIRQSMAGSESRLRKRNIEQQLQHVLLELADTKKEVTTTKLELARIKQELTFTKSPRTTVTTSPQPRGTITTAIYRFYKRWVYGRDVEDWPCYLAAMASASMSGNQFPPVVVKVTHVTDKKRNKEKWESAPFSAVYKGKLRKMYLCFDAASDSIGNNTVLLCWYVIMNKHDPTTCHGYESTSLGLKVQILNQTTDENHKRLQPTTTHACHNMTTGKVMIYSFEVDTSMDDRWYKNDCMFFEVSVDDTSTIKFVILLASILCIVYFVKLLVYMRKV